MEGKDAGRLAHVLVLPWPIQGHLNPMLQFSKRLASKRLIVTLITTSSMGGSVEALPDGVNVELVSENSEPPSDVEAHIKYFMAVVLQKLEELIKKGSSSKHPHPPKFLIYDSIVPGALDIAQQLGLGAASFFTQSVAVSAIYYHASRGSMKLPPEGPVVSLPSMPQMEVGDLPSFVSDPSTYPSLLSLVLSRFSNFEKADWLLFNTFDELEDEVVMWMKSQWPVKTIGPIIPSMYLDKRVEDDRSYGLSPIIPNHNTYMEWLHAKEPHSVVYVSFGTLAALGVEQMEELSWGLKRCGRYFLWVVRDSEIKKLPDGFSKDITGLKRGLVVGWCNQLEVLAHPAVGCFVTHCGWNSILEALSLSVPMVAMPQWTDQMTNAKFVMDVWGAGTRARRDERGIVTREEVELRIREAMEGERRDEIRKNAMRWKKLAKEAVDEGGSSDKAIEEIVTQLVSN